MYTASSMSYGSSLPLKSVIFNTHCHLLYRDGLQILDRLTPPKVKIAHPLDIIVSVQELSSPVDTNSIFIISFYFKIRLSRSSTSYFSIHWSSVIWITSGNLMASGHFSSRFYSIWCSWHLFQLLFKIYSIQWRKYAVRESYLDFY